MKPYVLALAAVAAISTGGVTAANAVEFDVGPGGVYVGPHHDRYYRDYRAYDEYRGCRVVITHHINRFGEPVTVRKRVCD
jgi:hypothetical protein